MEKQRKNRQYMKNTIKTNKAITLISLVVTIVVLLILAAVSVSMLGEENGIISKGETAKEAAEIDSEKEALEISTVQLLASKKNAILEDTEEDRIKMKNNLDNYTGSTKNTVSSAGDEGFIFKIIFGDSGRTYYIDSDGNVIDTLTPRYMVCFYFENLDNSEFSLEESKFLEISSGEQKTVKISDLVQRNPIKGGTFSYATVDGNAVTEFIEEQGKKVNLYYTRNSYTLTLAKADNNITSVQGEGTYKYGQEVQISATLANVAGHSISFGMWKSSNVDLLPNQTSQNIKIKMPSGDITLTATASKLANTYTIIYNGNGSTGGSTESSIHTYGIAKNLTANGFTKTGYTFSEWNTSANGSGTSYIDKQSVTNLTQTNGDKINLYAQWKDNVAPEVSAITVSDIQTTSVTASLTAQDSGSGTVKAEWSYKNNTLGEVTYTMASTDTWEKTTSSVTKTVNITGLEPNTSYTIQAVIYDASGMTTTKTATIKTTEELAGTSVEDLISQNAFTVGDYVEYSVGTGKGTSNGSYTMPASLTGHTSDQTFDVTSYNGNWQILYTGSEGYGAQIVSSKSVVGTSSWGTGIYTQSGLYIKGEDGYENLVKTLNTLSGYYINPNYVSSARALGSLPTDVETSIGNTNKYSGSIANVPTTIYAEDTNYTSDENQLNKKSQLKQAGGAVWLASRSITDHSTTNQYPYWGNLYGDTWSKYYANYGARVIYSYGFSYGSYSYAYLYPTPLVYLEQTTYNHTPYSFAAGVRPCLKLNPKLRLEKTTDGSGNTLWKIAQ